MLNRSVRNIPFLLVGLYETESKHRQKGFRQAQVVAENGLDCYVAGNTVTFS